MNYGSKWGVNDVIGSYLNTNHPRRLVFLARLYAFCSFHFTLEYAFDRERPKSIRWARRIDWEHWEHDCCLHPLTSRDTLFDQEPLPHSKASQSTWPTEIFPQP